MKKETLYQRASQEMSNIVGDLLKLAKRTKNFANPPDHIWKDRFASRLLLGGLGYDTAKLPGPKKRKSAWLARSAIGFSIERAATGVLYDAVRPFVNAMIQSAVRQTHNFTAVTPEWIYENPHLIPILMHASGIFSKQELQGRVGSVSDRGISRPASQRISSLLAGIEPSGFASADQIRERMKATTEGVVRDLVGRLLLEEFVASGLRNARIPFRREAEYERLSGVVCDFRADFVVPDERDPSAFLEVRKSSSRHASLYAKDKMFSAINWKGRHRDCLGIIIVNGPWKVTEAIRRHLNGDRNILRWLIHFRIQALKP
ncbi:MAG: hypothetical protein ACYS29_18160 [Planctomycetota bacterium]|jgi:hypothetical protein